MTTNAAETQTTRLQTFTPGSPGYAASTSPRNTSAHQAPALVLRPRSAEGVAEAVTVARSRAARLSVHATGHGAARPLGAETVLLDTGGLAAVQVQAGVQGARVGAGTTWGHLQREASRYGLLGLAGTSPSVGVAGYTFGGGLGWFTRGHGLASGHLRAVRYVDGEGRIRTAADDAPDPLDREAIWAGSLPELLGAPVVHLSYAATGDQSPLLELRDRLLAVAPPAADSTGPAGAERLGQIHLDPPDPVSARGGAGWLTGAARHQAAELLLSARVGHTGGAAMAELRHVDSQAPVLDGALTRPPGPYLFHVVGPGDATSLTIDVRQYAGTTLIVSVQRRWAAPESGPPRRAGRQRRPGPAPAPGRAAARGSRRAAPAPVVRRGRPHTRSSRRRTPGLPTARHRRRLRQRPRSPPGTRARRRAPRAPRPPWRPHRGRGTRPRRCRPHPPVRWCAALRHGRTG